MHGLAICGAAFLISHVGLCADPLRGALVRRLGLWGFRAGYSVVSAVLLILFLRAYADAPAIEMWQPPVAFKHVAVTSMLLVCFLLVFGYTTTNPSSLMHDLGSNKGAQVAGVYRITRHPVLWAVGIWGVSHLLASGMLAEMV